MTALPYETLLANEVAPFPVKEIGLRLENLDSLRLFRFSPILTQSSFKCENIGANLPSCSLPAVCTIFSARALTFAICHAKQFEMPIYLALPHAMHQGQS